MTRTIDQMIASEVLCCMSSLVATVAEGVNYMLERRGEPATELAYQAAELAAPVDDWEEAASQNGYRWDANVGWYHKHDDSDDAPTYETAREACEADAIDPEQAEVYEHWAVTDWFADKLEAAGEKVDKDFAGLCIWARTTTGQQIAADGVVARIYAETHTGLEG